MWFQGMKGEKPNILLKVVAQLQMLYSCWLDQLLDGWIEVLPLPQSLVWLFGFGANHSLLFIVQYWLHGLKTRQLQYYNTKLLKTEYFEDTY